MSEELFDIVKELFDWADIIDKSQGRAEVVMLNGSVFVDAAGEIIILRSEAEGLREERDDWQKACHKAWEELGRLTDEIERLRAEMQQVRLDHITTLGELQEAAAEIERLRAAGDVLAEWAAVDHSVEQCEDGCEYLAALRVWQEARRG